MLESVSYQWDATTQAWAGNDRTVSTYDDRGNTLTETSYSWDADTKQWTEEDFMEWVLDPATYQVDTIYYRYLEEGAWHHQRGVYEWDDHGGQIRETMYMKNDAGEWEKTEDYKYEDTYDAQGRLAQTIAWRWDAEEPLWAYSYKATYEYADDGVVTETQYNYVDGEWVPDTKYESLNDDEDRSLVYSTLQWNTETNRWESPYEYPRQVHAYDEAGRETLYELHGWDVETQQWELYNRTSRTYDEHGNLTLTEYHGMNNESGQFELQSRVTYEYDYDPHGNTLVRRQEEEGMLTRIDNYYYSPNPLAPVTGQAAVQSPAPIVYVDGADIRLDGLADAAVTLHDLGGRIVATAPATDGRATLTAPAPGLYVVRCGGQSVKVLVR